MYSKGEIMFLMIKDKPTNRKKVKTGFTKES